MTEALIPSNQSIFCSISWNKWINQTEDIQFGLMNLISEMAGRLVWLMEWLQDYYNSMLKLKILKKTKRIMITGALLSSGWNGLAQFKPELIIRMDSGLILI